MFPVYCVKDVSGWFLFPSPLVGEGQGEGDTVEAPGFLELPKCPPLCKPDMIYTVQSI